ncbi:MAG: DUF1802 family protein [Thermoanaerobaculia bacterium]
MNKIPNHTALKEWASIIDALGRGAQIVLIRKAASPIRRSVSKRHASISFRRITTMPAARSRRMFGSRTGPRR